MNSSGIETDPVSGELLSGPLRHQAALLRLISLGYPPSEAMDALRAADEETGDGVLLLARHILIYDGKTWTITDKAPRATPPASCPGMPYETPEGHVAEAERLLWVTDDMLQDDAAPRDLLTLAVLALAHAVTALAASEFPAEGGS